MSVLWESANLNEPRGPSALQVANQRREASGLNIPVTWMRPDLGGLLARARPAKGEIKAKLLQRIVFCIMHGLVKRENLKLSRPVGSWYNWGNSLHGAMRYAQMKPLRFIGESIQVHFDRPPVLQKKPGCPNAFTWRETSYRIVEKLSEWHDYGRRGRMAHNMRPAHAATARRRGSWGVGRDHFRVRIEDGRVFDMYYDRAPKGIDQRKGEWVLYREMQAAAT